MTSESSGEIDSMRALIFEEIGLAGDCSSLVWPVSGVGQPAGVTGLCRDRSDSVAEWVIRFGSGEVLWLEADADEHRATELKSLSNCAI